LSRSWVLIMAILLVPGAVLAAPDPPPAVEKGGEADLEAKLDSAREKLQEAAQEVAELTNQLNRPFFQQFSTFNAGFGRAIIGVQLDPSGGNDGAHVLEVSPGGPAAEAGVRAGDVIVAVNATEVKGEDATRQVIKIIRVAKPDSKLKLRVLRNGKPLELTVTPRPGPGVMAFEGAFPEMPAMPPTPAMPRLNPLFMVQGPLSNLELATLTPQLGKYFGTDKGVLVVRAPPDGALKLEDGDVLLAVDGREPKSGSHATRILSSYQPGEKVTLRIVRQHKTLDLEATVPQVPPGHRKNIMFHSGGGEPPPVPGRVIIMHRGDESI
jgi:C-terminal processing protease CtpA/Prc